MAAADDERRSLDFFRREERGGSRRIGRDDGGEIGATAGFDAGAHGPPEKSTRQGGGCVHEAFTLTRVKCKSGQEPKARRARVTQTMHETEWFAGVRDVHGARGDAVVLHGIDLALKRGDHAVILGPNGCGKSSLIKVLTCECYPLPREGSMGRIF